VIRHLVLFAREPGREAREKGISTPAGVELFASFARGWVRAAESAGARVSIAAPAEDLTAWRRRLAGEEVAWIAQSGRSFGGRLAEAAREAARTEGPVVFVGGDVPPDAAALLRAFEALQGKVGTDGISAVLSPAPDGGVSLLALSPEDHDLLAGVRSGSATVFSDLAEALERRGRRVLVLALIPDVDRRSDLRRLFRRALAIPLSLVRAALALPSGLPRAPTRVPRPTLLGQPSPLRAPPA
jgi:glycosyltransferase A (GT-A) superfamily protein (DUF2064 family)